MDKLAMVNFLQATCCMLVLLVLATNDRTTNGAEESPPVRHIALEHGLRFKVSIGTPPQTFDVLLNTGSAGTWVSSKQCPRGRVLDIEPPRRGGSLFDWAQSSTWRDHDMVWRLTYAIGVAFEGKLGADSMQIEPTAAGPAALRISNQTIAVATRVKGWMSNMLTIDGAVGVGERYAPRLGALDPVQTMFRQRLIPSQMFALHLDSRDEQQQFNGTLVLGGADPNHFAGGLHFVPTNGLRWALDLDYVGVVGQRSGARGDRLFGVQSTVLLDSSSNVLVGPYDEVGPLIDLFDGVGPLERHGLRQFDSCRRAYASATRLVISIGERRFELAAADLVLKLVAKGQETCYLALKGFYDNGHQADRFDFWTLGTPFLQKYYTVYDYSSRSVGFADARRSAP